MLNKNDPGRSLPGSACVVVGVSRVNYECQRSSQLQPAQADGAYRTTHACDGGSGDNSVSHNSRKKK